MHANLFLSNVLYFSSVLGQIVIHILLLLKLIEMSTEGYWTNRRGREALSNLVDWRIDGSNPDELVSIRNKFRSMWSSNEWLFTQHFKKAARMESCDPVACQDTDHASIGVRGKETSISGLLSAIRSRSFTQWLVYFFVKLIWRYWALMLLLSVVTVNATPSISGIELTPTIYRLINSHMTIIFLALWVEIIHTFVNRLSLGHADSLFVRPVSIDSVTRDDRPFDATRMPYRRDLVIRFATHFGGILATTIIAFAAIYAGINATYSYVHPGTPGFTGLTEGMRIPFELLYFSIVTIATVGYGDISPMTSCLMGRLAVGSEIVAGMTLLVFLLTTFSLTIEAEESAVGVGILNQKLDNLPTQEEIAKLVENAVHSLGDGWEHQGGSGRRARYKRHQRRRRRPY